MARIRTVKPDFFRHELLQDLEITHAGKCPMLVFAGLFGHCDKAGRFEWRPRTLKLDILPFMPFDMVETLGILEQAGLVKKYTVEGVDYGLIPTFTDHQRIGGKEAQEPEKYPPPNSEAKGKRRGSNWEATGKQSGLQEGKGREEEGKGIKTYAPDASRRAPASNGHRISFDFEQGKFDGITEQDELRWQEAYPAVPIPPAIQQAAAWLRANPANRKSNYERFLVSWFKRDQDKAGRVRH